MSKTAIQAFDSIADAEWAAESQGVVGTGLTLQTGYERSLGLLSNASRERYVAKVQGQRAGFLIISMQGAFVGYVQLLGVADKFRAAGWSAGNSSTMRSRRIFRENAQRFHLRI
jgi:hypothetical protein